MNVSFACYLHLPIYLICYRHIRLISSGDRIAAVRRHSSNEIRIFHPTESATDFSYQNWKFVHPLCS